MTPAERVAREKAGRTTDNDGRVVRVVAWVCRVRERRQSLGLSFRDVEKATGIKISTVSNAEAGYDVTLDTARRLAEFFGTTVEDLWPRRAT